MLYAFVLSLHNLMRWVVLVLVAIALVRGYAGWFGERNWTDADALSGRLFTVALDTQLLLGLLLYFVLSPLTQTAMQNFGAAMQDDQLRFFAVEHLVAMILAVILAHVGTRLARRTEEATKKHRHAAVWYTLTVLAVLVATPWWRPLVPTL